MTNGSGVSLLGKGFLIVALLIGSVMGGRMLKQLKQDSPHSEPTSIEDSVQSAGPEVGSQSISRAEILFGQHCAKCHGEQGHGDGEGLQPFTIRPRDFRNKKWRFAKTKDSIERVVATGIPGTSMPSAKSAMSEDDISQVAELVLVLGAAENQKNTSDQDNLISSIGFTPVISGEIPNVKLIDADGKQVRLGEHLNGSSIIHFWGTYCIHCLKEFPNLNRVAKRFHDANVEMISICADQVEANEIAEFANEFPHLNFYVDPTGLAMNRFSASLLPTMFLVDEYGDVIAVTHSALTDDQVDQIISGFAN